MLILIIFTPKETLDHDFFFYVSICTVNLKLKSNQRCFELVLNFDLDMITLLKEIVILEAEKEKDSNFVGEIMFLR